MFFDTFSALCKERKVSCKRATIEMGLSNSIAAKWKRTGATPNGETLAKIAEYFNVSIEYLLGAENENSPAGNDASGAFPGIDELNEANKAIVRSLIDQLLAAQSKH